MQETEEIKKLAYDLYLISCRDRKIEVVYGFWGFWNNYEDYPKYLTEAIIKSRKQKIERICKKLKN